LQQQALEGAAIGLYMRFSSKEVLQDYMNGGPKSKVVDIMIPHMTVWFTWRIHLRGGKNLARIQISAIE
jgi:hypothetical protein